MLEKNIIVIAKKKTIICLSIKTFLMQLYLCTK